MKWLIECALVTPSEDIIRVQRVTQANTAAAAVASVATQMLEEEGEGERELSSVLVVSAFGDDTPDETILSCVVLWAGARGEAPVAVTLSPELQRAAEVHGMRQKIGEALR